MRRSIEIAILVLLTTLGPRTAVAAPPIERTPWPPNCTIPDVIVGTGNGARVQSGFVVVLRNYYNQPIDNITVTIDFGSTGITTFLNQNAGTTPAPGWCNMISRATDAAGQVVFDARLSGYENAALVKVYSQDLSTPNSDCTAFMLKQIKGRSTDIVTSVAPAQRCCTNETTGLPDFTYFSGKYGTTAPECDFNQNGNVDLADLTIFSAQYGNVNALLCVP
jgi:hypothetical protein